MTESFLAYFAACPLVAILRGVTPREVEAVGEVLFDAGFTLIEVPLNSPDALDSIARLAVRLNGRAMVGAGTVLDREQVRQVTDAGGEMIISPNTDLDVIGASVDRGLVSLPGVFTPSEGFTARKAGATALKLFPAEGASPAVLKAWRAVMPMSIPIIPVGGIAPDTMAQWASVGVSGFGIGSALYSPGLDLDTVAERAGQFVSAYKKLQLKR